MDFDEPSRIAEGEDTVEQLIFGIWEGFDVAESADEHAGLDSVGDLVDLVGAVSAELGVVFEASPVFDEVYQSPHLLT